MKRNFPPSQPVSPVMRLFTILLCFAAGGFCLFKSGIGQSVEQPVVAASVPVKTAQAPSPSSEYKLKSVADFKVGDTIMALNHETGQREQKIVKQTFQRKVDHLRILEVQGEDGSTQTIKTTDEHPFWVPAADEYVEAKHLTPGTKLTGANGHFITVTSTRHEPHPEGVTVYNVEVEDFHNYFVAANGYRGPPVLAHNTCQKITAIGTMSDLKQTRLHKNELVDTWWKSGRIPKPGDTKVTWPENLKWLKARVDRGDIFVIASDPSKLNKIDQVGGRGAWTLRELKFLKKLGIDVFHIY